MSLALCIFIFFNFFITFIMPQDFNLHKALLITQSFVDKTDFESFFGNQKLLFFLCFFSKSTCIIFVNKSGLKTFRKDHI